MRSLVSDKTGIPGRDVRYPGLVVPCHPIHSLMMNMVGEFTREACASYVVGRKEVLAEDLETKRILGRRR
jgi:hypothetical protein